MARMDASGFCSANGRRRKFMNSPTLSSLPSSQSPVHSPALYACADKA